MSLFSAETLGAVCGYFSDYRSMSGEHATSAGCKSTVSYRWQVVRLTNDRFQLRRYPTILLAQGDGSQTDTHGNRTTLGRMAEAEADRPGSTRQASSHCSDTDV